LPDGAVSVPTAATIRQPYGDLPPLLWIGLPVAMLAIIFAGRLAGDEFYDRWIYGEIGVVELATVVFALGACAFALAGWRHRAALPGPWLGWWLLFYAAGAFYFAGEEASWGQHLIGWDTPEGIAKLNDHGETNLHNITNWADEKPKQVVDFASMFGGIALPLFLLLRGIRLDPRGWMYWFVPTLAVLPSCLLATVLKSFERLRDLLQWYPQGVLDMRMSEPQEMYFSLFFLFYAWSFYRRVKRHA
jgi:hypothetical protein